MSFLPVITEHPIMPLEESVAQLYIDGYRLLIRAQSLSPSYSMVNKNLVIAYLTIFMQGTAELYKNHSHWTNGIRTRTNEIYREFIQLARLLRKRSDLLPWKSFPPLSRWMPRHN